MGVLRHIGGTFCVYGFSCNKRPTSDSMNGVFLKQLVMRDSVILTKRIGGVAVKCAEAVALQWH